jgi:hypothetical protein
MTEAEWLACAYPMEMLKFLTGKASDRKLRLFACAYARQAGHHLGALYQRAWGEEMSPQRLASYNVLPGQPPLGEWGEVIVQRAEYYADGLRTDFDLAVARQRIEPELERVRSGAPYVGCEGWLAPEQHEVLAVTCAATGPSAAVLAVLSARHNFFETLAERVQVRTETRELQAELLRHIFGNPFRPVPLPSLPPAVVGLAEAVYAGDDGDFALSDALEEAGCVELAEHFRVPQWHPKGCFALDLILGRSCAKGLDTASSQTYTS